jgi:anti-sigma regulatory factor (Ser/Thr protein kinase)
VVGQDVLLLQPTAESAREARSALEKYRPQVPEAALDSARLLATELVANSIRHARLRDDQPIRLLIQLDDEVLRVEVHDEGTWSTHDPSDDGGWGLVLLERMADRFGIVTTDGTLVWFELDLGTGGRGAIAEAPAPKLTSHDGAA